MRPHCGRNWQKAVRLMSKWKIVRLGDVCTGTITNVTQKDLADNNGDYPIYGASGFIKCVNFYKQNNPYIAVVKDGAGVGRVSRMPAKSSVIGTMQYILPYENIDINYLYYAMVKMKLARFYTGATIPHIYFKDYKKEFISFPPLLIQKKIATILDHVNILIEKRKEHIKNLELLVKSRFVGMFGDPVTNPMGWEKKPLGKTCIITTGNTPPRVNPEYYGNYIEWIKTDNIKATEFTLTAALEGLSEKGFERCRYVEADNILMTCIAGSLNSIGNVAITNRRVAFNQQINALTPKEYDCIFLYWLLKMMKDEICSAVNMMLKGILSKGNLSDITAIIPPHSLQNRFTKFARQTGKTKIELQLGLDKLELLYKSLMHKYFN
jgi:type I restriction enzyme S subunit